MNLRSLVESIANHAEIDYARSGGPGGQHVNKVNTRVIARVSLSRLEGLDAQERQLVRARLASRITTEDEIIVSVQEERSQIQNRRRALDRLVHLIASAARAHPPRIPTRPTAASRERTLAHKHLRARAKQLRKFPYEE